MFTYPTDYHGAEISNDFSIDLVDVGTLTVDCLIDRAGLWFVQVIHYAMNLCCCDNAASFVRCSHFCEFLYSYLEMGRENSHSFT